jgi:hypothetical protein
MIVFLLLSLKLFWYVAGFLKANRALQSGNLEAVTCDGPPGDLVDPVLHAKAVAEKTIRPLS